MFAVSGDNLKFSVAKLVLEGVDTVAFIELNGSPVGSTKNMFVRYGFDVKEHLKVSLLPRVKKKNKWRIMLFFKKYTYRLLQIESVSKTILIHRKLVHIFFNDNFDLQNKCYESSILILKTILKSILGR